MKKMTAALSAVAGLAVATVAMSCPAATAGTAPVSAGASHVEVISGQVGAAPLRRCVVIDPIGVSTNHESDRYSDKQVVPTSCP
jgi:hypothetical protein